MIDWGRWPWSRKSSIDAIVANLRELDLADAGVAVNWRTALQASTAFACGRVISQGLAQVPLKLYRKRADGRGSDPATDHRWYDPTHAAPNAWQTSYEWRETMGLHLVFAGNAYSVQVGSDSIWELLPFEPATVATERKGYEIVYKVRTGEGSSQLIGADKMLHIRGPSWNTWQGLDGVRLAKEAIGLAMALEQHGARYFKNGASLGGILTTDAMPKEQERKALREAWQEQQGGIVNAYKTAFLWGGVKWTGMTSDNEKSQFVEARRNQVEEVCRAIGVLPIMVGYSDKTATYASAEQMFLAHLVHTMGPLYQRIEQALNCQLLSREERAQGLYFKHSVAGLLRGAHKDRAEFYRTMREIGVMNANEIREKEEMNPYDGGDDYFMPLNFAPIDSKRDGAAGDNST